MTLGRNRNALVWFLKAIVAAFAGLVVGTILFVIVVLYLGAPA